MKKLWILLAFGLGFLANAQIVTIPDANFKAKLLLASPTQSIAYNASGTKIKIDVNNDSEIQVSEALLVYRLTVTFSNIVDLTGIENFSNLQILNCSSNQLTTVNLNSSTNLISINCSNNSLTSLNVNTLPNLTSINCSNNSLTSLNVNALTNLISLNCSNNNLISIDVSALSNLVTLSCNGNELNSLNVLSNTNLNNLICSENMLTSLDVSDLLNLSALNCESNLITDLNLSNCMLLTELSCSNNQLTSLDISNRPNLTTLICSSNLLTSLNISNDINLTHLEFHSNQLQYIDLDAFVNLQTLSMGENPYTSLVNLSTLNNLANLIIENMDSTAVFPLTDSVMLNLLNLYSLDTEGSEIGNFNYNLLPNLSSLNCRNTGLTSINTIPTNIISLIVEANQLTSLDLTSFTNLEELNYASNPINSLIFGYHPNLSIILGSNTNLTSIDFSNLPSLSGLSVSGNAFLADFNIKNGFNFGGSYLISFSNCPNLQYICADEGEISIIQSNIATYGYTNCHVNTYCTFEPGGTFYTIQGNPRFDINNNGCDSSDYIFPNMKFNITSQTNTATLISGIQGNYHYDVPEGSYTITPVLENPSYYIVTPSTSNVVFPISASPFIQNFCLISNVGADLEVTILPNNQAQPGFDNKYTVLYKNVGGIPLSGTVNFTFDDVINDIVETIPSFDSQSLNNLSWNYTNLLPFESRRIRLTLNLNTPTENPAVNSGDIQDFTASVSSSFTDLTPNNNTFVYNQTVLNSYDPNDKTCLEGITITPDKVGEYVHYLIRFENTGTANAQNVVVKDLNDVTKFDVTTLIPIDGSHEFYTRITNTNQVEFIFENIQLPFDDANNDGYIAFKIKTKPTLVAGNTFSNTASIYFDYNFPIVTNTATTTIQALANQDFEFSEYFELAPNPAKESLIITTKSDIEVSSISIYNTLGQLVIVIPNAKETNNIDVSQLKTGTYFIKVVSDSGSSNSKFIKQ